MDFRPFFGGLCNMLRTRVKILVVYAKWSVDKLWHNTLLPC